MDGQGFCRVMQDAFVPFLARFGFNENAPDISGRLYDATFTSPSHLVSISYEPGDDAFFVMVFSRCDGRLSNIDDRSKTPRLEDLNKRYMNSISSEDRRKSELEFAEVVVRDDVERRLLKFAKELRLVLPKYLGDR